jgi:hypothetical protein
VGRRQIPQHCLCHSGFHHRKPDIDVAEKALADQAPIPILVNDVTAHMLSVDHFAEVAPGCDATAPYLSVFQFGLIAFAGINGRDPDALVSNIDGIAINDSGSAQKVGRVGRTTNDNEDGEKRR